MADSYSNFGVANTPIGTPSTAYGSFGVVNSNLTGLSTITNVVTESVAPQALNSGVLNGDLNSANFVHGSSGWKISANGDAEFQSLTGLTFTGATITGATITGSTFKTNASLPTSGNGVVIDSSGLTAYNSGNPILVVDGTGGGIGFNTPLGIGSGQIQGFTTNSLLVTIAGSGNQYTIETSALIGLNGQDLGDSFTPWGTLYYSGALTHVSDIRIKDEVQELEYGLNEITKLNPISYKLKGNRYLGFSAQDVYKTIPEITINCEDDSPVGSARLSETELIPVLVNAIKELKAQVDNLTRQITKSVV